MEHRLLLTAAGTGTGFGYALAAAQVQDRLQLVTADIHPADRVTAALYAQVHLQFPLFAPDGYLGLLNAVIADHGISHYLPLIDHEILFAAEHRDLIDAEVVAPPVEFVCMATSKRYADLLGPLGIPTARTYERENAPFPCFAKRPGSFGGRGALLAKGPADLAVFGEDVVLQEVVEGPEFTVDCFPSGEEVFCSVRERLEVKAGVCTKARISPDADLERHALRLARAFGLQQPFCFQAIHNGHHRVTDINPRLGAGTAMSSANGSNFFAAHLAALLGDSPGPHLRRLRRDCIVTRQYSEYMSAP